MATYDPKKNYTWTPEDSFTLTGQEFGLVLNMVRAHLNTEEAAKYQLLFQTGEVIEKIMRESVENDVIKEVPSSEE